jgi:ABC-2 type transport system permease protein
MLRFYLEVARTAFQRQLVYRWANLAGLAANSFFGAIFSYVYIALFHARASAGTYQLHDTLRYVWLSQAMTMVVLTFGWYDLMLTIRSGEVVSDLSKPCDLYWYWFSREAGRSAYYMVFRGIPTYLLGMLFFGIGVLGDARLWLIYGLSLLLATALGISFRFLYNIAAFWIVEARAVGGMATAVAMFFAGNYVPLAFFPPWLHAVAVWLPFNGFVNVPIQIYLGKLDGPALALEIARQVAWLVVLVLAARAITGVATRRVVVQGG